MSSHDQSRRSFLQQSAGLVGASWVKVVLPGMAAISQAACSAKEEQASYTILDAAEAGEFESIMARIIPATDTPGAREAGVIHFLDQSFGTFNAPTLPMLRAGLEELQSGITDGRMFSELSDAEQDALLEENQDTGFFSLLRIMTFAGFFGMTEYGGNKDGMGWSVLGMDPHVHAYSSPFGFYDAEYLKENPNG